MNIAPARPVSRDIATGNDVGVIVRRFYRAAIPDPLLGPVFERFGVDWSRHLPKLIAYWEHVLLGRPGLATNTVAVHGGVQQVAPFGAAEIARWVELWEETVDELVRRSGRRAREGTRPRGRARPTGRRASPTRRRSRMTTPNDTLADLVVHDAARARILDRLGLDYCCGGTETLDHACARAGLDTAHVVAELDGAASADEHPACDQMQAAELIRHLVEVHHAYLRAELPDLEQLAQKVLDVHGGRHPELHEVRAYVGELRADLEPHMLKEERVLFPAIVRLLDGPAQFPFGSIANPIGMMGVEHDRVGDLLARLRADDRRVLRPRRRVRELPIPLRTAHRARTRHPHARPRGEPSPLPRSRRARSRTTLNHGQFERDFGLCCSAASSATEDSDRGRTRSQRHTEGSAS